MLLVDGRLAQFIWYKENTPLSTALPWKSRVNVLRTINLQKAGEISFSPARQGNSLTVLEKGRSYRLDALGITTSSSTFFTIDNGEPTGASQRTTITSATVS